MNNNNNDNVGRNELENTENRHIYSFIFSTNTYIDLEFPEFPQRSTKQIQSQVFEMRRSIFENSN